MGCPSIFRRLALKALRASAAASGAIGSRSSIWRIMAADHTSTKLAARLTEHLFLLLILSLAFMLPQIDMFGFGAVPSDLIFIALAIAWLVALATGQMKFVWSKLYVVLGLYFIAMALSVLWSDDSQRSGLKLLTQAYLLSLVVIGASVASDERMMARVFRWWLIGAALVSLTAAISLIAFLIDPESPILSVTSFYFGTLPPGDYPRLRLTFFNGNMACNYLAVSLMMLFVAHRLGWIGLKPGLLLLGGILLAALLTISPGLGGIVLSMALWLWLLSKPRWPLFGRAVLAGGIAVAALAVLAMAVTPIIHPTAPFLIHLPILDVTLAPAGRLLTWSDAWRNFVENPVFGRGIGSDAVDVLFLDPSGKLQRLTDAHNTFLNLAVQVGLVGTAAFVAVLAYAWRLTTPLDLHRSDVHAVSVGLGLAFLNGIAYQGLGGSYEDARHLWVVLGLLLASTRLAPGAVTLAGRSGASRSASGSRR